MQKSTKGDWQISNYGTITAGKTEEILSEFNAMETQEYINIDLDGSATGLNDPAYQFVFGFTDGSQKKVFIGNANSTQSGYYARVDAGQTVIINQGGIENVLLVIQSAQTTPTPAPMSAD
jgi:hypothetical protein